MVLPIIFASCNDIRSDEEIIASILGGEDAPKAMTLSLWIPTESDTESEDFQKRLQAVENAINDILVEKNFTTKIDIIAISDSNYEKELSDRFVAMGNKAGQAYADGLKLKNEIDYYYPDKDNTEDFIYTLKYPKVLDYQLDLFLIRGYDNFVSYYEKNYLSDKLDGYTKSGSAYSNITKLIRPNILEQMKIDGKVYAIPNNHLYAEEYQYIAIDKSIFDSFNYNINDLNDIYDCEEFITAVGEKINNGEITNAVPFVGTMNDAPNVSVYDEDVLIGAGIGDGNISNIYNSEEYKNYVSLVKRLSEKGYISNSAGTNNAAVQFVYGTTDDVNADYSDNYYLIKSGGPVAKVDDVYASMFAISTYSIEYERAMKLLYLLQSDMKVRTLLQYGIEGEDYTVVYDEEAKENIIKVKDDTAYKMNILYTGNGYYTYPGDGLGMSDWDDIKNVNKDVVVDPFICFDNIINSDKISDSKKAELLKNKEAVVTLIDNFIAAVDSMTSEEFDKFITVDFITLLWEELEFYNEELGYEKEDMLDFLYDELDGIIDDIDEIKEEIEEDILNEEDEEVIQGKELEIKSLEFKKNIVTSLIRDVYTYGYSSENLEQCVNAINEKISSLEQEIQKINDNSELTDEEKSNEIAKLQEQISMLNVELSYLDVNSTPDEMAAQNEVIQGILSYIEIKCNNTKETLNAETSKFNELEIAIDAMNAGMNTSSSASKPLIFGALTSLNDAYSALELSLSQYRKEIQNYESLSSYLTSYVSNEAIEFEVFAEFGNLIKALSKSIEKDIDFGFDLTDGISSITIDELEIYSDNFGFFEDIIAYHGFVLEYVYGLNGIYEAISDYDFAFKLYTNEAYVAIIEFYNSIK